MAKRILTLCLALVIGIAFAMPAAAAVKSIKVGGDLTIRGIYRDNLDFGRLKATATSDGHSQSWLNQATRIWVGAELTDNVSVVVRLLNESDWDAESGTNTEVVLDLANIKMKDLFIPGFSATLGRQEILLGNGFVVGNVNGTTGNSLAGLATDLTSRKAFDAWRLDYEVGTAPVTVTLFDAKVNETATGNADLDLWGLNVGYKTDNLKIEGYALLLDNQTSASLINDNLYTYGARIDQNLSVVPGLNYNIEAAMQNGEADGIKDKDGWAGFADVSYTFQNPMQPKLGASWYYGSGDKNAHVSDYTGNFVPLYPDGLSDRMGRVLYASMINSELSFPSVCDVPGDNLSSPKIYGSIKPSEKHMLSLAWYPSTTVNTVAASSDSDELSSEIDLGYSYQYTEDVSFGLSLGYLKAGKAIKEVVTSAKFDDTALEVLGTVAVSF
ncbi:MAG: alginate export family protein [Candidatus Ratteibacteria bacterium]|jgi:hypothetical protein